MDQIELLRTMIDTAQMMRSTFDADTEHVLRMPREDGGEWVFATVDDMEVALAEAEGVTA